MVTLLAGLAGVVRTLLGAALAVLVLPACTTLLWAELTDLHAPPPHPWALGLGAALGSALVWWRRPNWLVHTLIHESCHALVATLLGVRVRAFQATDGQGGAVIHAKVDPLRTTLIALAPYLLPLLLAPALLARVLVAAPGTAAMTLHLAIGFLTVHHLHGLYHNVRLNFWGRQADLTRAGKLLSLVAILAVHALLAVGWLRAVW